MKMEAYYTSQYTAYQAYPQYPHTLNRSTHHTVNNVLISVRQ